MNKSVAVIVVACTIPGILGASKEGILTPFFCWLIVCAAYGYRFSRGQVVTLSTIVITLWIFVFPFAQNDRVAIRTAATLSQKFEALEEYISDPTAFVPEASPRATVQSEFGDRADQVGIIQRYSLVGDSAMLIDADNTTGYTGFDRYLPIIYDPIPHFIWPNRPIPIQSNELGHKAGFDLEADDTTTGITFGSPALFYDMSGWIGLPVAATLCFTAFFLASRYLFGPTSSSIWTLMLVGSSVQSAGVMNPVTPVSIIYQFASVFFALILTLKVVSYFSALLATRRTAR